MEKVIGFIILCVIVGWAVVSVVKKISDEKDAKIGTENTNLRMENAQLANQSSSLKSAIVRLEEENRRLENANKGLTEERNVKQAEKAVLERIHR